MDLGDKNNVVYVPDKNGHEDAGRKESFYKLIKGSKGKEIKKKKKWQGDRCPWLTLPSLRLAGFLVGGDNVSVRQK